ncbi:MAG: site-specific integrase [Acidimicrobiaceae bacterium]|nr:site-specific integrase [Acidimicrobiaceae bacterium]
MKRRTHGEGTVTRRKDGTYMARFYVREGDRLVRKAVYGKTQREAVQKMRAAQAKPPEPPKDDDPDPTLADHVAEWLQVAEYGVRRTTLKRYEVDFRLRILPYFGASKLSEIKPRALDVFYSQLRASGLAANTIHHCHAAFYRALEVAVEWERLPSNPAAKLKHPPPQVKSKREHVMNADQVQELFEALNGDRLKVAYVLAATTGIREGELLALKWSDVSFEGGFLRVNKSLEHCTRWEVGETKTERSNRTVLLSRLAVRALEAHHLQQREEWMQSGLRPDHDRVFTNQQQDALASYELYNHWRKLRRRLGVEGTFHDFRHSAATILLGKVNPKLVSEMLGHSSVSITLDIYSHVMPATHHEAAEAMDELLG